MFEIGVVDREFVDYLLEPGGDEVWAVAGDSGEEGVAAVMCITGNGPASRHTAELTMAVLNLAGVDKGRKPVTESTELDDIPLPGTTQ